MKLKLQLILIGFVLGLIVLSVACKTSSNDNNNNNSKDTLAQENNETNERKKFYLIPSPEDMFAFTKEKNLIYSEKVLNPIENAEKYIETRSKELNFGIYSADLAYAAAFSKYQESIRYLDIVRELSDEIGIAAVFDESLIGRIENIIDNKDSLIQVSSDTYDDIVRYLEQKDRRRTLALIAAGGWLESLYIVTSTIDSYDENNKLIQLVADQRIVFVNLMLYLEQIENDEKVKQTIDELMPIKDVFNSLKKEKVESTENKQDDGKIHVGGDSKIKMTAEQFKKLKETIANVRNKITANNVTL